jgi:predicted RNase H-like nuclease (RuvC/YqgF family)
MATKNQTMELARNVIAELDKEITQKRKVIEMIERSDEYKGEIKEMLIMDWTDNMKTLERLREFVIYKA